jgi:hypothetical protein
VSDQKKRPFFKRLSKAHTDRKAVMRGEWVDPSADQWAIGAKADYDHVEAFYDANPARRESGVAVGSIDDGGLHFSVSWCSGTNEVFARAANWIDAGRSDALPQFVVILGNAETEQAANHATAQSDTLEMLRDRLYA